MANACTICRSEALEQVEELLRSGESGRSVARLTGLSRSAVARHVAAGHVARFAPAPADPNPRAADVLERVRASYEASLAAMHRARKQAPMPTVLSAEAGVRSSLALLLRAPGLRGTRPAGTEDRDRLDEAVARAIETFEASRGSSLKLELAALAGLRQALGAAVVADVTGGDADTVEVVIEVCGKRSSGGTRWPRSLVCGLEPDANGDYIVKLELPDLSLPVVAHPDVDPRLVAEPTPNGNGRTHAPEGGADGSRPRRDGGGLRGSNSRAVAVRPAGPRRRPCPGQGAVRLRVRDRAVQAEGKAPLRGFGLPVLHGDRMVGKVDAAADRDASRLDVRAVFEDVRFTLAIKAGLDAELRALAAWLGLDGVRFP
jgi:hypothetical protein